MLSGALLKEEASLIEKVSAQLELKSLHRKRFSTISNKHSVKDWERVADNLRKAVGIAAVFQARIRRADSFGLWPQCVRTRVALLCCP
jgi:hypothetical protein